MFCTKCGTELNDDAIFCSSCGEKVNRIENNEQSTTESEATEVVADVEICEKCNSVKHKLYRMNTYMNKNICINCDVIPGRCPYCKGKLRTKTAQQCPTCKSSWHAEKSDIVIPSSSEESIRCPKCRSTQISANQKGFSTGKAIAGGALLGGVGLLGGLVGSKKVEITCLKCGHKWKPNK